MSLAARQERTDSGGTNSESGATAVPQKHKRTWPWTRAQRWLVAKGIGGGAGAGARREIGNVSTRFWKV